MDISEFIRKLPRRETFAAGTEIFREGDVADVMYLIVEGEVRLTVDGETIATELTGGVVGEMALIDKSARSATAIAVNDCILAPVNREWFVALIREKPEFAIHLMSVLVERLRLANQILSAL